jgi:hypothetical protein
MQMGVHEELLPGLQCTDNLFVLNTTASASKDLAPQSVIEEMLIDKTDDKMVNEGKCDESMSPAPTFSESSVGIQNYQEGAEAFSEPQSAHDKTYKTKVRSLMCFKATSN